jgi:molybdenum cofactor cytidylyltransferase
VEHRLRLAVIVLAAGAGSRFSAQPGAKLLAELEGRPALEHVLVAVRQFGSATTVVVLGSGADRIERAMPWSDELRVRNHAPEAGLASSLKVGIDTLRALPDEFDGAFIVLGDQPRLRSDVMSSLEEAALLARPADRPLVVPAYEDERGPRNPLLLLRPAWSWVDDLRGDRGLAPLVDATPDCVLSVPVAGSMPDLDTQGDLERISTT